jgi:hypothetical protein
MPPAPQGPSITPGLEKFAVDGKLDATKIGQSYLEIEKTARQAQAEVQRLTQVVQALSGQPLQTQISNEQLLEQFVADPKSFVKAAVEEMAAPLTGQLTTTALMGKHPELANQEFKVKFFEWYDSQPESVQQADSTLEGADWLVSLYKERAGIGRQNASQAPQAPHTEAISAARPQAGVRFSRSRMRQIFATDPAQYQQLEPEYSKAMREGRVDP